MSTAKPKNSKPHRKEKAKPKTSKLSDQELRLQILQAAFDLAAEQGWPAVSSEALAHHTGLARTHIAELFPDKIDLLHALEAQASAALQAGGPVEGTARERLFELILRRCEALQPYKAGIAAVMRHLPQEPQLAARLLPDFNNALAALLQGAELPTHPLARLSLAPVALYTFHCWLKDESADMAATMATLDKALGQLEDLASFASSWNRRKGEFI